MSFNIRLKVIFFIFTAFIILWFLYAQREIISPFLVAMVFAYIFNPLISYFAKDLKISRTLSIFIVYLLLIGSVIFLTIFFTKFIISESESIANNFHLFLDSVRNNIESLPSWAKPYFADYIDYFSKSRIQTGIGVSPLPLFSKAFSGILSFFIFLFSAFVFLKDGHKIGDKLLLLIPYEYRIDASILGRKINSVLSSYLRGQLILIFSMVIMLLVIFLILGVKYAVTISVFSAILEIIPIVGPIAAGVMGTFIILISGGITNFQLDTLQLILLISAIYVGTRLIQDYFVMPIVMGKVTKLHPLMILFSVLAGGHIYGIIGIIFSVPIAATIKIIYEFALDKVNQKDRNQLQKR